MLVAQSLTATSLDTEIGLASSLMLTLQPYSPTNPGQRLHNQYKRRQSNRSVSPVTRRCLSLVRLMKWMTC
jgi:hypothetical protein